MDYNEIKGKIGIDEAAYAIGYKLDKKQGVGRFIELSLSDGRNGKTDTIIIENPNDKARQHYFHRHGGRGGDLINFVRENSMAWNVPGKTEYERVNYILAQLANIPMEERKPEVKGGQYQVAQIFNPERFIIKPITENWYRMASFGRNRGLTEETFRTFAPFMNIVVDTQAKFQSENLGFPYHKPGEEKLEGFEIRTYNNFKMKAAGTNSSQALWLADFSKNNPESIRDVYFTESAYDAMALYQANKHKIDLEHSVFASVGGNFSDQQVAGTIRHYKNEGTLFYDAFDNDLMGRIYGSRLAALTAGKHLRANVIDDCVRFEIAETGRTFDIPKEKVSAGKINAALNCNLTREMKAPKAFKDWNDLVMGKPMEAREKKTKFQITENMHERNIHKITR